jgi:VIT1/CCC1 family predicted Fe2+/Mn2+ transporter
MTLTLSHHEQQALDEISAALRSEDPRLAAKLRGDGRTFTRAWHQVSAGLAFLVGSTALLLAVLVPHRTTTAGVMAVSILAYLVMFGAAYALVNPLPRQ